MEELEKKHRQERKDLQARIMQKKKSATKKTRKGVNDECADLERRLEERQTLELSTSNGESGNVDQTSDTQIPSNDDDHGTNITVNGTSHDRQSPMNSPMQIKDEKSKKPNRQKARLARKAAEQEHAANQAAKEAEDLPDLRHQENEAMRTQYRSRGLNEHAIQPDGHCLYAAIADQLLSHKQSLMPNQSLEDSVTVVELSTPSYKITRSVAASYIKDHADAFLPFLEEPLDDYVHKIRNTGEWGGHLELLALAKAYNVDINVLQSNGHVERVDAGTGGARLAFWLAYYHHSFGLGEHYNSLRQAG
ncbi:MAG: hypothetical protein Q9170_004355 [Blastenia crenularia]